MCATLPGVLRELTGSVEAEAPLSSSKDREGGMRAGVEGVGGARDGVVSAPPPPPARRRSLNVTAVGGLAAVRNKEAFVEGVYGDGEGAAVDCADGVGGALRRKFGIRSDV